MNTQKIQAGAQSTKGFTLVELIVVITILVILGTIAFLNVGGMSASARDSQRTSDLNQINAQITTVQAKTGLVYSTLVTAESASGNVLSGATVAGNSTGATAAAYTAGDLNYGALGIDSAKFSDPKDKVTAYKIGQTTLVGGQWEIAASLEAYNGSPAALVMGTYRARTIANTTSTGTATTTTITLTSTPSNFKIGDWLTTAAQITAISTDTKTITYSGTTLVGSTNFALASNESLGLTASGGAYNSSPVTNYGTVLPY